MKFVYIVNSSDFFCSHFINLAKTLKSGYRSEVHIIAGDTVRKHQIENEGFVFHYLPLSRKGMNPITEIITIFKLKRILNVVKPDIVHAFTIKPIVYYGLLSIILSNDVKKNVYSVTGLGSLFLSQKLVNKALWHLVKFFYKVSFRSKSARVFFENNDDRDLFISEGIISEEKALLVNGAGIDTNYFTPLEKPLTDKLIVTFVGRLLKDKGVRELLGAAQKIKEMGFDIEFLVVGDVDTNNISSLSLDEIQFASDQGYITYLGVRDDINLIYGRSDIACLPSYREGLPKSLIEASASGCAILTTDAPGCRQMVDKERNGLLCKVKSVESLVEKILYLYENPDILDAMKLESRKIALEKYGHCLINRTFFDCYGI